MEKKKLLIVDDDSSIRFAFNKTFDNKEFIVLESSDGKEAISDIIKHDPHVIFLDYSMPELDGFGVMETLKKEGIDIPVIMITGFGNMQTAIKAIQLGAYEYITKPLDVEKVRILADRAIELYQLKRRIKGLESTIQSFPKQYELIGNHPQMQEIYKSIGSVTATPNTTNVLISGESGTGKELVARAIHLHGPNKKQPFIGINCTVLPEPLIESELFGHEKGAFTGAIDRRIGKFEEAQMGTIFLDEIGDISQNMQQKLLRVLQERQFERLGSNNSIQVNARFISSTNHDLISRIEEGQFRKDLYYRLNVISIHLPPLRDRKEDIPLLAEVFLNRYSEQLQKRTAKIEPKALNLLIEYDYPGNVRELENIIKSSLMVEKSHYLTAENLPSNLKGQPESNMHLYHINTTVWEDARRQAINQFERQFVSQLLRRTKGNVTEAAKLAKIERQSFQRIMKKYRLFSAEFK